MRRASLLQRGGLAFLLAGAAVCPARADTVHLKNGRTLEGIIEKETDDLVRLQFGVGSVDLKRARIASVTRSAKRDNEALQKTWKTRYLLHERYAPEAYRDVAEGFRKVEALQRAAVKAHGDIKRIREKQSRLRNELKALEENVVRASRALAAASPDADRNAYNAVVAAHNTAVSRLVVCRDTLSKTEERLEQEVRLMARYIQVFADFETLLATRREESRKPGDPEVAEFFRFIVARTEAFSRQFEQNTLPVQDRFGHMVLECTINGRGTARLMLDTGASVVTLSELAAKRLNLDLTGERRVTLSLADGTLVEAEPVLLDSVQAGEAYVERVAAAVMPHIPTDGVDGLLGMSFLREFVIRFDAANRDLVLKRFHPK